MYAGPAGSIKIKINRRMIMIIIMSLLVRLKFLYHHHYHHRSHVHGGHDKAGLPPRRGRDRSLPGPKTAGGGEGEGVSMLVGCGDGWG